VKVLATGDIHGDTSFIEELAHEADANNVDLIIIAGDIADWHGPTDNLIGPLLKENRKVCIIPGNHDTFASADFLAEMYGITNLHGYTYKINDVALFGCGGANIGMERLTEETIYSLLSEGHNKVKDFAKRIMVTHVHPSGTAMEHMSPFVPASSGVRRAVEAFKPDILLCCHVHEASGIEEKIGDTKVINVSKTMKIFDV